MRAARSWPLTLSAANSLSKIRATVMGGARGPRGLRLWAPVVGAGGAQGPASWDTLSLPEDMRARDGSPGGALARAGQLW